MNVFEERGISHLDLHGTKHQEAESEVLDFIYQHQALLPLIIICGNSNKMVKLVSSLLNNNQISYSSPRFGILRIEGIN